MAPLEDATALRRGASRLRLQHQRLSRRCHGLVPWSFTLAATVATIVRLHGTSPWHLGIGPPVCSDERETPRDKPVASQGVWLGLILKDHKFVGHFLSLPAVSLGTALVVHCGPAL